MKWIPATVSALVGRGRDARLSPAVPARLRRAVPRRLLVVAVLGSLVLALAVDEMRGSLLSSLLLPRVAARMHAAPAPGPAPAIRFPKPGGPYDARLGYSAIPDFLGALRPQGWEISAQARPSPLLLRWFQASGHAVYPEKTVAGLVLLDRGGTPMYQVRLPERTFGSLDRVPTLLSATLLQIEDQHLLDPGHSGRNPAVDWPRFLLAIGRRAAHAGRSHAGDGGASTLATQIEKFRHSPQGLTDSGAEKLRQMATAALRAYAGGGDTTLARRQLIATYLDSVPLASRAGYGEVIGLGDGLRVWYGLDLEQVRSALEDADRGQPPGAASAKAYKHVLSLLLAERRPTYYLVSHHDRLERLCNYYLRRLADAGVITPALRDLALAAPLRFSEAAPSPSPPPFVQRKAVDALRNDLLADLRLPGLGALDRLDLTVHSTIDARAQGEVTSVLQRLGDPAYAASLGLVGKELLPRKGLDQVRYSVLVYARTPEGNALRVHADSLDQPFDINSGGKLILGSTAKLRTLITYLDIVVELHQRLAPLPAKQRDAAAAQAGDPLSTWAADYLDHAADHSLSSMLDAALQRRYSASPGAVFFTGGGAHVFHNFKKFEDGEKPTVEDAFARSVNLAFVRLLRDITRYYTAQQGDTVRRLLNDPDDEARRAYLRRFADQEGTQYLNRYYEDYRGLSPGQALEQLVQHARPSLHALTAVFAALRPGASTDELYAFLREHLPHQALDEARAARIFAQCRSGRLTLSDQGYLARVHPLELWLLGYLRDHPDATRAEVIKAGALPRQQAYDWLFRTRHAARQNERIQILLEQMAFERVADDWHRQGYPFHSLVPSLATAIGSSGDRPDALAELAGIVSSGGLRLAPRDMTALRFAAGTPYETDLALRPAAPERVLEPEVAAAVHRAMGGVVEYGTAQRLRGAYLRADGVPLPVAGKTGTGDNRLDSFAPGHRLISSTATSRSAAFVFLLGERHFGVITVYVPGAQADQFHFTSALAVQLLRALAPALSPLIEGARAGGPAATEGTGAGTPSDAP